MSRSELGYYVFRTPEKTVLQESAAKQNTLGSNFTLANNERMRENSKKHETKADPSVADTIKSTVRKTRKSSDSGISVSLLPLDTIRENVPLASVRGVRIRKRARKDEEESDENPELVEMALEPCQQCKECSLWIKRNKLLPHACKHGDQQRFRCSSCEYQGATYAACQKHINRCHRNEKVKIFDWTRDKSFGSYKRAMMQHCFPDPARYDPKPKHSRWQRRCVLRHRLDYSQPSLEPRDDVVDQPHYDLSELFDNYQQCRL